MINESDFKKEYQIIRNRYKNLYENFDEYLHLLKF